MCQLNSLMFLLINSEKYISQELKAQSTFYLDLPSSREININYILYANTYRSVDAWVFFLKILKGHILWRVTGLTAVRQTFCAPG